MLQLDGSHGEGGGQILRTALSLSALLCRPFQIKGIRANRPNPGLAPQHLAAVEALQEICGAQVEGDRLGSQTLAFRPQAVRPGSYVFDVARHAPSAGSATLLLQALLPPLLFAGKPSELVLRGGTHVAWSPPFEYLQKVFLPALERFGVRVQLSLQRQGFYPEGGGEIHAKIAPTASLAGASFETRGALKEICGVSACANLPLSVAERQKAEALKQLVSLACRKTVEAREVPANGKGSFVFLHAAYERAGEGFSALGGRAKSSEEVGREAAQALLRFHASDAAVDAHLADQLLVYAALAVGETRFSCEAITPHVYANLHPLKEFLPGLSVTVEETSASIRVKGVGFAREPTPSKP